MIRPAFQRCHSSRFCATDRLGRLLFATCGLPFSANTIYALRSAAESTAAFFAQGETARMTLRYRRLHVDGRGFDAALHLLRERGQQRLERLAVAPFEHMKPGCWCRVDTQAPPNPARRRAMANVMGGSSTCVRITSGRQTLRSLDRRNTAPGSNRPLLCSEIADRPRAETSARSLPGGSRVTTAGVASVPDRKPMRTSINHGFQPKVGTRWMTLRVLIDVVDECSPTECGVAGPHPGRSTRHVALAPCGREVVD